MPGHPKHEYKMLRRECDAKGEGEVVVSIRWEGG
jgi:hypothetical protein